MQTAICPKLPTADLQLLVETAQLPSMPAATIRLLKVCARPEASHGEATTVVMTDPTLAARVVGTANAQLAKGEPYFSTIPQAVEQHGMTGLRSLALTLEVNEVGEQEPGMRFDYPHFWRYSLTCASASRLIAKQLDYANTEEAYFAGLLQDLGVLVLQRANPAGYGEVRREKALSQMRLFQKERELLGYDHTDVGAAIAAQWRLPRSIGGAIHKSHAPGEHALGRICFLSDLVHRALYDGRESTESDAVHTLRHALSGDTLILPRMQVELSRINHACECPHWTEESVADLKQRIAELSD